MGFPKAEIAEKFSSLLHQPAVGAVARDIAKLFYERRAGVPLVIRPHVYPAVYVHGMHKLWAVSPATEGYNIVYVPTNNGQR